MRGPVRRDRLSETSPEPYHPAASPRIVFDTNVVASALLFSKGRLAIMRHLWRLRRAVPLVSRTTAAELLRVLAYPKFKLTGAEQDELLGDFLPFAEVVEIPSPVPKTPPCRDPKDRPFLELAMAGRAEALVTGDDDLLVLRGRFVVPILRPEEWLATLQGDK